MITDNFYPIFTLPITILACVIQKPKNKNKKLGELHPYKGISLDPLRGLQLPPAPQLQLFLALPKTNAPIFFLYHPLISFNYKEQ